VLVEVAVGTGVEVAVGTLVAVAVGAVVAVGGVVGATVAVAVGAGAVALPHADSRIAIMTQQHKIQDIRWDMLNLDGVGIVLGGKWSLGHQ
jgi:hypothetical protein